MKHRHLEKNDWSAAAVDSILEYGDLEDWRALFAEVDRRPELAETIRQVSKAHPLGGASALALSLLPKA